MSLSSLCSRELVSLNRDLNFFMLGDHHTLECNIFHLNLMENSFCWIRITFSMTHCAMELSTDGESDF